MVKKRMLKLFVCVFAIGLTAGLAHADIESGLTGYWSFEEGSGATTADISGNGHDGTLVSGAFWVDGPAGCAGALSFNPTDRNHIECGNFNPASAGGELTIALWANMETLTTEAGTMVSKRGSDAYHMFQFFIHTSARFIRLHRKSESAGFEFCKFIDTESIEATMPLNEWTHLVVTLDGTYAKLYINGEFYAITQWHMGDPDDDLVRIGEINTAKPNQNFNGIMDEVRLYNRVLDADDVMLLYEFVSDPDYNAQPTVDAGDYQSLLWQDPSVTAQLDATVTDDGKPADPGQVTLTWSKLSGPGNVVFSDTTIEDPTATFDAAGTYELRLRGYDGEKDACDVVKIYIRPDNDPIAHWDFDEGSGPTVNDDSANNNEGTLAGDTEPNWVSGWVGSGAMEFFGVAATTTSSYVNIATDDTIDPNLDSLRHEVTLAAWFKIDDLANTFHPAIIATSNKGWRLYVETPANDLYGKVTFTPGDSLSGSRAYSTKPMNDGYWHHVVGVYDYANSKSYLYIDGVLDTTEDNSGMLAMYDVPVTIGTRCRIDTKLVERSWNGMLDDVYVYGYALSAAQVEALAAMGSLVPVVDAGENQMFYMQYDSLQLDATVTDDGNPVAATLTWTQTDGPGTAIFSDAGIEDPTVTFSEVGTYVLTLTADDTTAVISDSVTITVENPTCQDIIDDGLLKAADISGPEGVPDCYVDLYDFAAIAGNWLYCNNPQDPDCVLIY